MAHIVILADHFGPQQISLKAREEENSNRLQTRDDKAKVPLGSGG